MFYKATLAKYWDFDLSYIYNVKLALLTNKHFRIHVFITNNTSEVTKITLTKNDLIKFEIPL